MVTVSVRILCDNEECENCGWVDFEAEGEDVTVSATRAAARRAGWILGRNGDYCPECATLSVAERLAAVTRARRLHPSSR